MDTRNGFAFPDQNIEQVVGNGRLVVRATAGQASFVFGGAVTHLRLLLDGEPADAGVSRSLFRPGHARYELDGRAAVTHAAAPDADAYVVLVEAERALTLTLEVTADGVEAEDGGLTCAGGVARVTGPDVPAEAAVAETRGVLRVSAGAGETVAFWVGPEAALSRYAERPAAEYVAAWEAGYRARGLRLRTPDPALDRAVDFFKYHMQLGYDWRPEGADPAEGPPKMVCDIFRWRDVWSRDFGSGFGPGALAAGLYDGCLDTLEYELARHAAVDPSAYKVTDDTSQGGSAEGLGWLMRLVWRTYQHTGDLDWLRRMAAAFAPWMEAWIARDADEDGLVADVTEWMDHSRYLRLPEGQRTLYSNVLYYAALRRFSHIARELGDGAGAERYHGLARRTRDALREQLWNPAGYFNNAVQWGVVDTACMLADNAIAVTERVVGRDERRSILHTLRERNWRPFGSVTCDLPMKYIEATNDHNVKAWPWWMAHEAKARFLNGDPEGALHVVGQIVDTLARPTFPGLCEEYLNPDDGTQDEVAGHAFITGAGATLGALLYGLVGLQHLTPGDRALRLTPSAPRAWDAWSADVELYEGRLTFERTPDGYRVTLSGARCEALGVRVPPEADLDRTVLDGSAVAPPREGDDASEYLRFALTPGADHVIEIAFTPRGNEARAMTAPPRLPAPLVVERAALVDEPGLISAPLQACVRDAAPHPGGLRSLAADDLLPALAPDPGASGGEGPDLLVVAGNALPWATRGGEPVPPLLDRYLEGGGALLLLGPRFARIDPHTNGQMGEQGGLFWWKVWREGRWVDFDPREEHVVDHPLHEGAVYWGDGPLFPAWEQRHGLFGFAVECRGVYAADGGAVDPDVPVGVVYTDWVVRLPWRFHPLAFTERARQWVTGPRVERYPCAALWENAETGARIVAVAPALCARADLLRRVLALVVRPAPAAAGAQG